MTSNNTNTTGTTSTSNSSPLSTTQSQTSLSSATTLVAKSNTRTAPPPKDYSAALGNLQSAVGLGGQAPLPVPKKAASAKPTAGSKASATSSSVAQSLGNDKDYAAALGDLATSYGVGGGSNSMSGKK